MTNKEHDEVAFKAWIESYPATYSAFDDSNSAWHAACAYKDEENNKLKELVSSLKIVNQDSVREHGYDCSIHIQLREEIKRLNNIISNITGPPCPITERVLVQEDFSKNKQTKTNEKT